MSGLKNYLENLSDDLDIFLQDAIDQGHLTLGAKGIWYHTDMHGGQMQPVRSSMINSILNELIDRE